MFFKDNMIFVTVGASLPFDRLIEYIDKKIAPLLNKKILAQIHDSATYLPKNIEYVKTENKQCFDKHITNADLVITHAGMGVIIDCIKNNKKLILVPRDPSKGELADSHQYEICEYLKYTNKDINIVYNLDALYDTIIKVINSFPPIFKDSQRNLVKLKRNLTKYFSNYSKNEKIFIVCSSGGHLRQMLELIDIFPKEKIILITNNTKTKLEGITTHIIKGDFTDNLLSVRSLLSAPSLIIRYKPSLIFTNGGGEMSFPFACFGKIFGCKIIFLETISRVTSKSKAARLVYPIADVFLIQWEKNLSQYGNKAQYWGSVI
jgi:beta-1,4-N-acetylglucosaminyltransferase